jgi:carbon storage regulator
MVGRLLFLFVLFHFTKEGSMLVLSRKVGESIQIADNIAITVVQIRGDKVRLGIEAPKDVPVNRHEVYDALQKRGETHIHGEKK